MLTSGRHIASIVSLFGVLGLAACGGGGAKAVPAPTAPPAAPSSALVQLTVPNRVAESDGKRGVQYVSPNTQSVMFTANGTITTKINLTGSICVPNAQANGKLCTFSVAAPVGLVTFAMQAYDQPFTGGVLPGGYHTLSAATNFTATIAEGTNNTVLPVVMGGIPATMSVAFSDGTTTTTMQGATSKPLIVTVYDASGAVIVAPGVFVNAAGTVTPIAITSVGGFATSHVGYTYTPASTGVSGAIGAAISFAEPDDRIAYASDGMGYVHAGDTFTHSGVPNHTGGALYTGFSFGYIVTPSFTPKLISPLNAAQSAMLGHEGVLLSDTTSQVGFIGDISGSCYVPSSGTGNVTAIGGITTDPGTDPFFYVHATDPNVTGGQALYTLTTAFIASSNCTPKNQAVPSSGLGPFGIAAANAHLYGVASQSGTDFVFSAAYNAGGISMLSTPTIMNGGADFGTAAVGVTPNGSSAVIQFSAKKKVALISASGSELVSQQLSTMFDPYPYGLTVDSVGDIFANDMTSATFGSNGGVDEFPPGLAGLTGRAQLNAPIVASGPYGSIQNMTVGSYLGGTALFVACTDGIEVFTLPLSTPSSAVTTITPAAASTAFGLGFAGDGRVWLLLANGQVEALPPY